MKVVILAGGMGSRLCEETVIKPKPMVLIGNKPILWHIMKIYSAYGFNEFVICLGYKGYMIKEYFSHYHLHHADVTIDFKTNEIHYHRIHAEPWKVTLVDTGHDSMTGGRIRRVKEYVDNETFMMTYGDGLGDVNIRELVAFHKQHGRTATVTSVRPPGRFGTLELDPDDPAVVRHFREKPSGEGDWINAGFFVLEPDVFDYLHCDADIFEQRPLQEMASGNRISAFQHHGFWRPMDTLRDKNSLESLWETGKAPWKIW
ncbi:MAG: glucose-1-phosphate cytidylyltransferase [Lentisphaeria bacterium]|nr:glucose-1-phosphate cytidylyltransferase [Lentisphaeria bacterium]